MPKAEARIQGTERAPQMLVCSEQACQIHWKRQLQMAEVRVDLQLKLIGALRIVPKPPLLKPD